MMKRLSLWCGLACELALTASPVHAGLDVPPAPVDTSNLATKSDVAAVASAAAQKCDPMPAIPPPEAVGGAPGSGTNCRLATSVQPRITRVGSFTTAVDGTATVTWTDMGATPALLPMPNVAATATMSPACFPVTGSVTSTGGRIKCFVSQTITVSILGATLAPVTTAGAGVTGSFFAIPNS